LRTVILASFGLALLAASAEATPKAWDRTWQLTTQADVHLIAGDAHIRIHTGPPGQVAVHVEYDVKHWGMMVGGGEPVVVFEHKDDQIWITQEAVGQRPTEPNTDGPSWLGSLT